MELARIVAMFLVLVLHADFLSLGWPTAEDSISNPVSTVARLFIEALSKVCVNVFVLISGWFGIRAKLCKGIRLLATALFYSICILIAFVIIKGKSAITVDSIKNALMLSKGYWFVKSYLFLMIVSPALNALVETISREKLRSLLLILFAFQTYFGWSDASFDYHHGFSALLFVFLYLLARYIRLYPIRAFGSKRICICLYLLSSILMTGFAYLATRVSSIPSSLVWYTYGYLNPVVILSSVSLMMFFTNVHISSKLINWISSSALAVYLIHANDATLPVYTDYIYRINEYSTFPLLQILTFIIVVFVSSILIDKIRIYIFELFEKKQIR